ncbi:CHASE3 domain-containing protein [Methylobacterium sp. yr668]|uniref:adenylate/guanylate cyclase domain-containing protein n=1 Tax=Methylobacterium sp. yr668 TaxID=1761801 RepID=UPI0008E3B6D2|nr:CHASE3 domain-containing protein [Methylobacterium sp. yr668]SFT29478.1 adenylate cyclase [Methylobacterium sp. yr668]
MSVPAPAPATVPATATESDRSDAAPDAASVRARVGARVGARVQRSLRSRTVTWMTVGFATILVMTAIALGAFVYQQRGVDAVRHTVAVDGRLARVLSAVQDAETGQRGYLLTGDEAFLLPFTEGRLNVDQQLDLLRDLVQDDPDQRGDLDTLAGLIRRKLDELGASVALMRAGDGAAARASVADGRGKQVMDAIRDRVRRMEAHEARRMERRQATVSRIALAIWVMVGALAVLFVLFAVSALREATRRNRLSRFLPQELVLRLADGDGSLKAGRRQQAAIVFVDMRGSTTLAESLDPHRLSEFLSAFRRRVTRLARLRGGVVDKFIGDGALVVFGLPEPLPDDAARALAFAQDLVAVIARWTDRAAPAQAVRIGVGVHYGEVFCGIIGEEARYEFTVLGDAVNVAARLEQATKLHGVPILVSEAARRAAGAPAEAWREVSREPLRGRRERMAYHTPAAPGAGGPGPRREEDIVFPAVEPAL